MDDGVASSLADHEIGPLHNDDGHEEGCVAGVLEHLALGICLQQHKRNNSKKRFSSSSDLRFVPTVETNIGIRAFSVAAPTLWNGIHSLLSPLYIYSTVPTFSRQQFVCRQIVDNYPSADQFLICQMSAKSVANRWWRTYT